MRATLTIFGMSGNHHLTFILPGNTNNSNELVRYVYQLPSVSYCTCPKEWWCHMCCMQIANYFKIKWLNCVNVYSTLCQVGGPAVLHWSFSLKVSQWPTAVLMAAWLCTIPICPDVATHNNCKHLWGWVWLFILLLPLIITVQLCKQQIR